MKKILSCFVALFAAVSLYATDLNIYASGLKVHQTASGATIDYMLNAPATTLNVYIYGPANTVTPVKTIDLSTDAANLTKGAHAGVAIDLTGLPDAVYTWAIEAGQTTVVNALTMVNDPDNDPAFQFYLPQDVVVDNCFNSPFFGRIYVGESTIGQSDGGSVTTKAQGRGIYIYNSDLTFTNGKDSALVGYDGNIGGTNTGRAAFKRLAIDEEGFVYVASRDASNKGIYRMDPADPSADFVQVLAASAAVDAIDIVGNEMYTIEGVGIGTGDYNKYDLSTTPATLISSSAQTPVFRFANPDCSWRSDKRGGFWGCQTRGQLDGYPCIVHVNSLGVMDYCIDKDNNNTVVSFPNKRGTYRGVIAVNPAGDLIGFSDDRTAAVYSVEYDSNTGVPSLTLAYQTGNLGSNIDGVAFDVADNFYVASASVERFYAYATPKGAGENIFTTPAPSAEYISLPCVEHLYEFGDNQGWALNAGVEMTKIATNVFQGEFTFANATSYFTLSAALGTSADDWGTVNDSRYGADNGNEPIANGDVKALHLGWGNSFAIPAGKYRITADLNALTVTVKQLWDNIYMFNNITGDWVLGDGVALTKTAENVFELDECEIPEGKYVIFSTTHGADWASVNAGRLYPESVGNFWVDGDGYASISATPDDNKTLLIKAGGKYAFTIDLNEGKIFYTQLTAKVSFDAEIGYATYYNGTKGYTMPANVTGYAFNYPGAGLTQAFEAGDDVPAGVALVLAGPAGTFDLVLKEGVPAVDLANQLRGTDADELTTGPTADSYLFYGLSLAAAPNDTPESVGFYWMAQDGGAFTNKAHKAYLALLENFLAPEFLAPAILFNENNATNIENVEGQEKAVKFIENGQIFIRKDGVVYDAMGRVIR
ncbi:MAG: hypothetical protein IKO66_01575 [Paludibacteraceae bacterium]|nr:hypothetical protein [Paludibacteraceae bacterium]